jgi:hypothetical protein
MTPEKLAHFELFTAITGQFLAGMPELRREA